MRRTTSLLPLFLLPGCLFSGVDGVWMLEIAYPTEGTACSVAVDETFLDASYVEPDAPDSAWTVESETDASPTVSFVQIRHTAHGEAVLLQGDHVYPGTAEGGVWTFTWKDRSLSTQTETHESGYTYEEEEEDDTTVTFRFEPDGEDASGKVEAKSVTRDQSVETDEWDAADVGLAIGQLRAGILESDVGGAVRNLPEDDDCQGNTCELTVTTTCSSSSKFTAIRTNHEDDDYEYLAEVGQ